MRLLFASTLLLLSAPLALAGPPGGGNSPGGPGNPHPGGPGNSGPGNLPGGPGIPHPGGPSIPTPKPPSTPFVLNADKIAAEITTAKLLSNLKQLQLIADANGGNRAFGLPGYRASVDFVLKRIRNEFKTLDVREQELENLFAQVDEISLKEVGKDEEIYIFGFTYSPSTSAEGITAELVLGPEGDAGCDAANYAGIDAKDKIVLVQRHRYDFVTWGGFEAAETDVEI